jgi:hypothetical protein
VFVLKKNLLSGGGQAATFAKVLDRWAQDRPDPYLGPQWPSTWCATALSSALPKCRNCSRPAADADFSEPDGNKPEQTQLSLAVLPAAEDTLAGGVDPV